ncbi:MAG: DUF1361 domain-containing protein [Limisphaerales bacterium]
MRRETAMPMLALVFASVVCMGLVFGRILWTRNIRYSFLIWNLFLAWLPLVFALLAQESFQRQAARNWRFAVLAGAWLLFFPNAPYIFTDLIHLTTRFAAHFWVDLMLILPCALTGMVLGFVSLYLMQGIVKRLAGVALSWVFVAGIAGLSGFGVWLGRFLRFNSWDVLSRPVELYRGIGSEALQPLGPSASIVFAALFALFLLMTYVMLYALTHLRHSQPPALPPRPPGAKTANPRVAVPLGAV